MLQGHSGLHWEAFLSVCNLVINWCHKISKWFITNLLRILWQTNLQILQSHIVSLGTDLFAGARLFLVIFFCIFVLRSFCQESIFFLSQLSIPRKVAETFAFQSKTEVSKSVNVCVCASELEFVCVSGCCTPWRGQLSEFSCSNVHWHLCLPLTQKQNCYLLYTLQRHTNETGGGNTLFLSERM